MSDILGISRPTVDKWIHAGIIQPDFTGTFHRIELHNFTTHSILRGLEKLIDKH